MKAKKKLSRKVISYLLAFVMVFSTMTGIVPGMSLTAYADGKTYNPASTYTGFGDLNTNDTEVTISEVSGKTWYVIANDSTTVTLLSKQSFGNQKFNSDTAKENDYETSEIKTYVDGLTGEGQPLAGISSVISDLTLIDTATAQGLSETKRKGAGVTWWLRSPGDYGYEAKFVRGANGGVYVDDVDEELGVRPALKLDLTKVTFDSTSKTFSLKPYVSFIPTGSEDASALTAKQVTFKGYKWYIIEDNSSSATEGTVTLLAADTSFGTLTFKSDGSSNSYNGSDVKAYLDKIVAGTAGAGKPNFMAVADAIQPVTLTTYKYNSTTEVAETTTDAKLYLLSTSEAEPYANFYFTGADFGCWWLRSPGNYDYTAALVHGQFGIYPNGYSVTRSFGVRPALKLDLTKVTFDSATNTFALLPTLWVGGVQVTSANKDDVLGDTDEGATVVFTPAVDDNAATTDVNESSPATLTLNGADISGGNNDSKYAAIYADGFDLTINVTENSTVTGPETNDYDNSTGIKIHEGCLTITGSGRLTTTGGESANGASYGIDVDSAVTINGPLNASGGETQGAESCGIYARNGITVSSSGTLAASGGTGEAGSYGIWASVTVDGSLSAIGNSQAIYGTVKNSVAGTGWTDTEGTTGKASIAVSEAGRELNSYKKVQFPAYTVTYKVVNGTWSDDSTTDKTEDVPAGSKPSSVPTGMKASEGYMGGAWDTNPADLTITEAKTFTYTFTAKSDQTAPTGLTATKASSSTATDGKISGVTSAMEYQADGASTWTSVGENKTEITGLTSGTYKVRYAETADKNASPETSVEVGVKVAPTVTDPTAKTLTYNGQAQELVTAGSTDGGEMQYALGTATEATEQYTTSIPEKTDAGTYYVWYKVVGDANHNDTEPTCVTSKIRAKISATVTFKVVNGSWDDGTTSDKTVTLTGYEGDTLNLATADIPAVGSKPGDTYKTGSWDVIPSVDTAITEDTTYTYTYAKKDAISKTVTFKVVNGSWNDGTTADKTVTLTGYEGDTLNLATADIPAVGSKPGDTYKTGSWDVIPSVDTAITEDTTYTYTYAKKDAISKTVTFKVVNGSWNDGTTADKTVTLTGYEGDTLKLAATQIPAVGTKPSDTYKAGSWNVTPSVDTAIENDTTYTYTYAAKTPISEKVTFKVVNGSWDDGTTADKTVTLTGYEGDTLNLATADIPAVGNKPSDTYKAGSWDVIPSTDTAITKDTTYTYTYVKKDVPVVVTQEKKNELSINAGFKVIQKGSKITIKWGKVEGATGYEVYVAYCGKNFSKIPAKRTTTKTSAVVSKIGGKKIDLKKNFKVYVKALKKDGSKNAQLAKTITGHVVGRKNTKYTNAKSITLITKTIDVEVGKRDKIKAKTVLVSKKKKQLSDEHATEFRYTSSDESIATVDKNGNVTGVAAGTTTVYVYSRNGLAKTVKITVK